jgi:hypothetical protein
VPSAGVYREIFNTDAAIFGGSNLGNGGAVTAEAIPSHGRPASISIVLPPLAMVMFKPVLEPKVPKGPATLPKSAIEIEGGAD